jgi:hypothetical protein
MLTTTSSGAVSRASARSCGSTVQAARAARPGHRAGARGGITPANVPEAQVTGQLDADLAAQHARLAELHIDRACLASAPVRDRGGDLAVDCKVFPVRTTSGRFARTAFTLDFDAAS